MRTIFTVEDAKRIVEGIFNEQNENIILVDEYGNQEEKNIRDYLNIKFYSWKNRLVSRSKEEIINGEQPFVDFETFTGSLKYSMDESYALVEMLDAEVFPSQDIDNAVLRGRITFLIQSKKIENLEYFCAKIRSAYLGEPQDIINSFGEKLKAYLNFGMLLFDNEPETMQLGECIMVSMNFNISYLTEALSYKDMELKISLDGENFYDLPYVKGTFQNLFITQAVATQNRPDLTGFMATSLTSNITLSFYDFNKTLTNALNDLFWGLSALKIDNVSQNVKNVNIPIWLEVKSNNHTYLYKKIMENFQKNITNGDFNVVSISLKGYGKEI